MIRNQSTTKIGSSNILHGLMLQMNFMRPLSRGTKVLMCVGVMTPINALVGRAVLILRISNKTLIASKSEEFCRWTMIFWRATVTFIVIIKVYNYVE